MVGLGDKMGGLTVLLKLEEEAVDEVEDVVVEEGKCEALFTASHMETPGPPPPRLEVVVKEVVEAP